MKQPWKRRKEAWRLAVYKQLGMAATGAFLAAAGLGSHAQAQPLAGDSAVRPLQEQEQVEFALTLPLNHQSELNALIAHLYTPGDAQFHHFLSSAEFDQRFGPTAQQYETLKSLAQQYGLTITREHSSRTLLDVAAPAATIRNVFGTQMHLLQEAATGRQYYAPDREAVAPFPLAALGAEVAALQQKPRHPHISNRRPASEAEVNAAAQPHAGTSPSGSYGPADIKAAYNLGSIQNGGQAVALYELSSAHYADSTTYASKFGLTNTSIVQKTVDGGTTDISGSTEVMLDIDMVMAISNPATLYVYTGPNSGTGVLDTYTQIANDDLVNQVSSSWGLCESSAGSSEANAENTAFTKMVAEGIAVFAAAGDSGAYDCGGTTTLAVDDPASQPNVTGVGGTSLTTTSTQAYTSEKVWDTSSTEGGGGGISILWNIPSYQQGIVSNAPSGQFSTTKRNVPDVSLDADPATGYYIYDSDGGGWGIVGGTSAAAPLWAGFWSLTGKGLANAGVSPARAGFANQVIYSIAKNAAKYASDFHDVATGTNNHYSAVTGYDDATGWGSFNGANLYADVLAAASGSSSSSSSSGGSSSSSSGSSSGGSSSSSSSSSGGSSSSSSSSSSGGSSSSSSSSSSGSSSSSSSSSGGSSSSSGGGSGGTLQNGVAVTNLSAAQGKQLAYSIAVPAGATNLTISISGGTGDADLYVKFGSAPTLSSYDCRPYVTGNNETCSFAAPQTGTYYIMLNAYAAFSGVTLKASYGTTTALQNGVPVTGLSGAQGSKAYYSIAVPAGKTSLKISISGGSGDADLYVKQGSLPTLSSYNCRPYITGNNESCSFSSPSGTYYIMLNGYAAYSGVTLTGTYQ